MTPMFQDNSKVQLPQKLLHYSMRIFIQLVHENNVEPFYKYFCHIVGSI